ncbi:hypothetical protein GGR55DRAFT_323074 [Xylaria sp. FL0064]|nr:hypothetical protein GGR55DRAFT_323074 [Xylaria sp. FL0064]
MMTSILLRNDTDYPIHIPESKVVGHLETLDPECTAYQVGVTHAATAAAFAVRRPASGKENATRPSTLLTHNAANTVKHPRTGVNIYDNPTDKDIVPLILELLGKFGVVFRDKSFADIPQEDWMKVELKPRWQKNIPWHCRVYPLARDGKNLGDNTIDKMKSLSHNPSSALLFPSVCCVENPHSF